MSPQLQGSLRRKIEGQPQGYAPKQNGLSGPFGSDCKRLRVEGGVPCAFSNGQSHQALQGAMATGHALQGKAGALVGHGGPGERFAQTLREMKKEPGELLQSCGRYSSALGAPAFDFKDEPGGQIDPELQDLFDELTKSVPSLDDLEFDKILKQEDDEAFHLELGRPASAGGGRQGCSPMLKVVKSEYSPPPFCQASGGLQQLRPASAGPVFSLANASSITGPPKNCPMGGSGGSSRSLPPWQEVSHAEQLKQMAANQQPAPLMHHPHPHHHQQSQSGTAPSWSPAMSATHSSPGSFGPEKVPGPSSLVPSMNSQAAKGMNNCLFKPNGHGSNMAAPRKPMLHFSPKVQTGGASQVARATGPQGKQPPPSQQPSAAGQNQPRTSPNFPPNPLLPVPTSACLQPKSQPLKMPPNPHGPSLHFTRTQQRQNPPGPHLSTVSTFLSIPGQPQQQPPPPNGPQNPGLNTQPVHRPMPQPQKPLNDSDKMSPQDQLSRHLTRPPPDYKQQPRRNVPTVPQTSLYTGGLPLCISSSQSLTSTLTNQNALQTSSCQLATGQPPKMAPPPSDRRFEPQNGGYSQTGVNQLQQHCAQNPMGLNPNKPRFPGNPGMAFGSVTMVTGQHVRPTAAQEVSRILGPRLGSVMTASSMGVPTSWGQGPKDSLAQDIRRYPNTLPPHPGGKNDMGSHKFTHRPPMAVPNQIAPDIGLGLNGQSTEAGRNPASRLCPPRIPGVPTLNPGPPLQATPSGNFSSPAAHNPPRPYQSGNTGTLTFDFLQEGDNTVPGINTDSDFIDSLLKSGPSNDDWMQDINLDEILGSQS
ncbi:hypothetical protein COCON_G00188070 [Conger conger]|uniref:Mastermind-like protein 2 n=1 Tax=Conger conger TaxID=82655 RepID=A0A9Q1HRU6_CONCO|nr:hypothetical protein COCON_G00188070 [Conger conger]